MQEAMIVKVVVKIADQDGKRHPAPEFLNVLLHRCPMLAERIHNLGVGMLSGIGGFYTEQSRR